MDKYVRKATATKLYDALLIYGDSTTIPPENFDEVCFNYYFYLF